MPKYLIQASYTNEGLGGLMNDTAANRMANAMAAIESVGGHMEALYWAFGDWDVVCIAEFPDNSSASAFGMGLSGSGAVRTKTTPLLSAPEVDKAIRKHVKYVVPGGGKAKKK